MTIAAPQAALRRTPLHRLHLELNARMVPFAGYDMPVQYAGGILKEHLHVRAAAGLFDVSHMGQFVVRAKSGRAEDAARALESLVPVDIVGLAQGRQRYALLTNEQGGIRDDLMIANLGDRYLIVDNAACKDADEAYLRPALAERCDIERLDDRALLALQGPAAEAVLAAFFPAVTAMRFMDIRALRLLGCRLRDLALRLYRRGRFRDQCAGGDGGKPGAQALGRCARRNDRPWRPRQSPAGGGALPLRLRSGRNDHAGRSGA